MKQAIAIGLGVASFLAIPALAEQSDVPVKPVHHHHVYRHLHRAPGSAIAQNAPAQAPLVAPVLVPSFFPYIAPYPDGQGDEDGLIRGRSNCDAGCIDQGAAN